MNLIDELQTTLNTISTANQYWVAYSGGCDSHVLLHALNSLTIKYKNSKPKIAAVHVNHGLQDSADKWSEHCKEVCNSLDIQFMLLTVDATAKLGQSPEAAAREARYHALSEFIPKDDILLVAHHQDDQAETLLLQLLRGAGPRGLSAMPKNKMLGGIQVVRPFLNVSQNSILEYAKKHQLDWIDDPSNTDTRFDRNRLRHEVLPILRQRWPSLSKTLSRVTQHQAEAVECLRELAEIDWQNIRATNNSLQGISIIKLTQLSLARQKNVLRFWIEQLNSFDAIDNAHLNRILNEVIPASNDSQPKVNWQNTRICRYREILYILKDDIPNVVTESKNWQISSSIELTDQRLISRNTVGEGIKQSLIINGMLNIRYRQGGERCQPKGRANHHSLKKLFQEWSVPPWERSQIPLLYIGSEIVQIVGYCVCEPYIAGPTESGILVESERL